MKKLLFIPAFLTQLFLGLMFIVGLLNISDTVKEYGWVYDKTTIIGEQSVTQTIYVHNDLIAIFFLAWLIILLFILVRRIRKLERASLVIEENQYTN